ncbi:hypothetical protein DFP72DRAFT_1175286 [Ephemerocybe angulata]|uniref:Uncharacterized protein n=1 Tax=Ephemerocybe angulata TaxID=980116 RepID=A0A8H6HI89_9AGAR|nr:hypothetical protein DFP72DRAFT_1175286 [Tulosesus angulatus]
MRIACSKTAAAIFLSIFSAAPVYSKPAGTIALEEWFKSVVPQIFPNSTTNWQAAFENGLLDPNIKATLNGRAFTSLAEMRGYWSAVSAQIASRTEYYITEPEAFGFATDAEGRSGYVIGAGRTSLKTKQGDVYKDGGSSAFVNVVWNTELQKRVITEWKEVNTSPNYPNYPWS